MTLACEVKVAAKEGLGSDQMEIVVGREWDFGIVVPWEIETKRRCATDLKGQKCSSPST